MDSSGFLSVRLMFWRSEYVCDVEKFTVSELIELLIQLLRPYNPSSHLVRCIEMSAGDGGTVQYCSDCGSAIGHRLVAPLRSEDDKDAARFGIALLRPPRCLSGRPSINMRHRYTPGLDDGRNVEVGGMA
jgi:hypothetical protein